MVDGTRQILVALATLACAAGCKQVTMNAPVTVNPVLLGPVRTLGGAQSPKWQKELGEPDVKTEIQSFAMASSSTSQSGNVRTTTTTSASAKSSELQVDWTVLEATHGDGHKTIGIQAIDCSNWGFFFIAAIWSSSSCTLQGVTTPGGPPSSRPAAPPFGALVGPVMVAGPPPGPAVVATRCVRDADCGQGRFCDADDICKVGAAGARAAMPVAAPPPPVQAATPSPPAGSPGYDTVYLKNGGRFRGHVMTDEPSGVSVQLLDGTTRKLKRPEVDHIDYGK